jgi:hypothetical protein
MESIVRRAFILSVVFFALFVALRGVAHADCGKQYINGIAPTYLAAEKTPLTQPPLIGVDSPAQKMFNLPHDFSPCPDDSKTLQFSTQQLGNLWYRVLNLRAQVAIVHVVASGGLSQYPPACAAVGLARTRFAMAEVWHNAFGNVAAYPGLLKTLPALPYDAHVLDLWHNLAASVHMSLPPPGSSANSYEWVN